MRFHRGEELFWQVETNKRPIREALEINRGAFRFIRGSRGQKRPKSHQLKQLLINKGVIWISLGLLWTLGDQMYVEMTRRELSSRSALYNWAAQIVHCFLPCTCLRMFKIAHIKTLILYGRGLHHYLCMPQQHQAAFHQRFHLHFTSVLSYFNYSPVGSVYLYVSIFFSVLVWQGVNSSGKNAEAPKIATWGCQVTSGYVA